MTLPLPESGIGAEQDELKLSRVGVVRARPRPGERRMQILRKLAQMLEQPHPERITTAALAAQLGVSEAALYRHFASKAQMYEGLIDFIEQSVLARLIKMQQRHTNGELENMQLHIVGMLLQFAQSYPGLARVMTGDALVHENDRLQVRMTGFFEHLENTIEQTLLDEHPELNDPKRAAVNTKLAGSPQADLSARRRPSQIQAGVLMEFALGRLQRYVRSGFERLPCEGLSESLALLGRALGLRSPSSERL